MYHHQQLDPVARVSRPFCAMHHSIKLKLMQGRWIIDYEQTQKIANGKNKE